MKIEVMMFGALRRYGDVHYIEAEPGLSVSAFKACIASQISPINGSLVDDAVLATETEILPDEYIIKEAVKLSLLPPVCGG